MGAPPVALEAIMSETFSKSLGHAFQPEELVTLSEAFQEAWERIQAVNGYDGEGLASVREILGRHIIKLATDGEGDLARLRDGALAQLGKQDSSSSNASKTDSPVIMLRDKSKASPSLHE
jgi:hypothetical protein